MEPQVRYVRTSDEVSIAFWAYGEGPVLVQGPLIPYSHIEMEWQNPHIRRWYERIGEMVTVVRYDGRGTGLSQREITDVSLDAHVRDLEAVVSAMGSEQVVLMGVFHSGPPAIAYAIRNPDRVSQLILWCTYASGAKYWKVAQSEGLRALRQTDYLLFLRTASHELIGWADDGQSQLYAEIMRRAVAPEEADRQIAATREFDVTGESRKVGCPALVIHRRDLDWIGVELSRDLAADLEDAGLVVIDGRSPLPGAGEIASAARSIGRFLDLEPDRGAPGRSPGEMRAVLFTDLVDHTRMMSSLGDTRGRDVLREHERITRQVLADHDGTEVKALGDGFMASFGGVTKAVECAIGLQRRIDEWNAVEKPSDLPDVAVRIGLNAGEPIEEGGDLFGATVILASRIAGSATAGEILVANTVRELSAGKGFNFVDRGTFTPKGFDEPMHVWAVEWRGR